MYGSYIMKRTQIYLEADQDRRLATRARADGTTKSTVIREAIETYLSASDGDEGRLAAFQAAVDALEDSPVVLPDGRSYVEALRARDERRDEELSSGDGERPVGYLRRDRSPAWPSTGDRLRESAIRAAELFGDHQGRGLARTPKRRAPSH
jgi:predicted DNA-binding protein